MKPTSESGKLILEIIGDKPDTTNKVTLRLWKQAYNREWKRLQAGPINKKLNIVDKIGAPPTNGTEAEKKRWRCLYQREYHKLNREKALQYQKDYHKKHKQKTTGFSGGKGERGQGQFIAQRIPVQTVFTKSDLQSLDPVKLSRVGTNILSKYTKVEMA